MTGRVSLVSGDELQTYDLGPTHPLRPERIKVALALMRSYGLLNSVSHLQPRLATDSEILLFHLAEYLETVKEYSSRGYGLLDAGDTPAFKGCYEAAGWVVGASLVAAEAVINGVSTHAFNLSGGLHHAHPDRASGFCIFNDPAISINYLKKNYGIKRVAYVDIDAHHGDGVMYGFYSDPSVLDIDLHEDGRYLFPGTGSPEEIGKGDAAGLKFNVPLPPGTADDVYLETFEEIVPPAIRGYSPELIMLQSGADSHRGDLLSHLSVTANVYYQVASKIHDLAHELCDGRVIVFGGGGYRLSNVARCWTSVLSAFTTTSIPNELPIDWQMYYRSIAGEEAPTLLMESAEKSEEETGKRLAEVLSELKRMIPASRRR
ncbi:acetoin utilization protein AcuC [Candidatus Bathyarchaeota archaeon]|nr:acetoin utilization protein AcuC [Candidatus Bathyarchaeota archaeon]